MQNRHGNLQVISDGIGDDRFTPIDLGDRDNIALTPEDPTTGSNGDFSLFFGSAFGGLLFSAELRKQV